jgi:hypothetical protein
MFHRLLQAFRSSRPTAATPRRGRRPALEVVALESRTVLSLAPGTGAPLFVTDLYNDLLFRTPSTAELNYWVNNLRNGGSTYDVAHKFVTSTEHLGIEVQGFYNLYLGHPPDAAGQAFWVNQLQHGGSPVALQLALINSAEYQAAHASDLSYVDALYNDVLRRAPDAAGETYWVTQLQNGVSRDQVARSFFNNQEYANLVIQADFNLVLGRNAEPSGVQFWTQNLRQNLGNDAHLLVALFISHENLHNL